MAIDRRAVKEATKKMKKQLERGNTFLDIVFILVVICMIFVVLRPAPEGPHTRNKEKMISACADFLVLMRSGGGIEDKFAIEGNLLHAASGSEQSPSIWHRNFIRTGNLQKGDDFIADDDGKFLFKTGSVVSVLKQIIEIEPPQGFFREDSDRRRSALFMLDCLNPHFHSKSVIPLGKQMKSPVLI